VDQDSLTATMGNLERIYREHGDRLWWAVLAFSGDREVASDAVAEAFAQALRRGEELHDPLAWIWRVAFRVAAGELKRRRQTFSAGREGEESYEMPEQASELISALALLSVRQRAAIVLHDYAGFGRKEVAGILGIAAPTVGVHLHRGRKRLREILEEEP
jgi:RNA polymerase sigma factor (sigma-70 family)